MSICSQHAMSNIYYTRAGKLQSRKVKNAIEFDPFEKMISVSALSSAIHTNRVNKKLQLKALA